MKDAQKPDHISLSTLIARLNEGRFVIPDFQREFEWKPWDIRDLMRSIFLDYYIGSLLLWKGKPENFEALACEPIYGFQRTADEREHIVLDGQQRLTALYYAVMAPNVAAPSRANRYVFSIRVDRFAEEAFDEAFTYDWTQGAVNALSKLAYQFENHRFPFSTLGKGGWEIYEWIKGYEAHWRAKAEAAADAGDEAGTATAERHAAAAEPFGLHIRSIFEQYQVSYVELDRELPLDKVCDIFTQVNSKGIRLDVFDLINALLKPRGIALRHLWRDASQDLSFVETDRMNIYILQVMSILRQAYCSPKYLYYLLPGQPKAVREEDGSLRKQVLVPDPDAFLKYWDQAVSALKESIRLLRHPQEYGAISAPYVPYSSILPAFAALQVAAKALPAELRLNAQRKIRIWYWASVFNNRYSATVESTSTRDFLDMTAWFKDDGAAPALVEDFRSRYRAIDLRREVRRGTSVYNGVFNMLVIRGARDWIEGKRPKHDDLDDHHIVPRDWISDHPEAASWIDSILNRTPLTAETNRHVIRNRLPNAYLPELFDKSGEKLVREILVSHLISDAAIEILLRNPFEIADFEAFLGERERTIEDAIEDHLFGEHLDLPPDLRQLDDRVTAVELGLRRLVDHVVGGESEQLPPYVKQKLDERISAAAKKDVAFDATLYETLRGQLEFADLRDLQAIISAKHVWPKLSDRFPNKVTLDSRFDQLAELRNALRHTRTVGAITQKDGEAALLYFESKAA